MSIGLLLGVRTRVMKTCQAQAMSRVKLPEVETNISAILVLSSLQNLACLSKMFYLGSGDKGGQMRNICNQMQSCGSKPQQGTQNRPITGRFFLGQSVVVLATVSNLCRCHLGAKITLRHAITIRKSFILGPTVFEGNLLPRDLSELLDKPIIVWVEPLLWCCYRHVIHVASAHCRNRAISIFPSTTVLVHDTWRSLDFT